MTQTSRRLLSLLILWNIIFSGSTSKSDEDIVTEDEVQDWAMQLREYFYEDLALKYAGAREMETIVQSKNPIVKKIDGTKMVLEFASQMEEMLGKKIDAIKNIVNVTEFSNAHHTYDENLQFNYYNANFLNQYENGTLKEGYNELALIKHDTLGEINWNVSTIQVPINIYKADPDILNGIYFTEPLNEIFWQNYQNDKTLMYQYFSSSTGFFRNYPGLEWTLGTGETFDSYDARERPWYLQASHSPKDVVILLDVSGSMTGSRLAVAKKAIETIVDTLLDDDFFNIVTFNKRATYLEECFEGYLVQANADNKGLLKNKLQAVSAEGIADFDNGLTTVFELLAKFNESGRGSWCNQAIMLLTDGAVENFEYIFKKYNWPDKKVRVFTYIIGRDVKNAPPIKWMACHNKGYYAQIATLADVKINVMQYIHVLSRPMVIEKEYQYKWTNVYLDISGGNNLMTTVSMPAFDTKLERANEGILLGVAGVDVTIAEMVKLTPSYRLGLNGYVFAITNNGYILFHPELRPTFYNTLTHTREPKPNYNSVDFSEVELFDESVIINDTIGETDDVLRSKIVEGETGDYTLYNVTYRLGKNDEWRRITNRTMIYFFTSLKNTPFRLGIALEVDFGLTNITYTNKLDMFPSGDDLQHDNILLDKCIYCEIPEEKGHISQLDAIRYHQGDPAFKCNREAIKSVLEDAYLTGLLQEQWNGKSFESQNITAAFVGCRSGLMRFHDQLDNRTLSKEESTLDAEFFQMAASMYEYTKNNSHYMMWIPHNESSGTHDGVMAISKLVFAAQNPFKAVFGAVGIHVSIDAIHQKFKEIVFYHPLEGVVERYTKSCTCKSDVIHCYIIDHSGYLVQSEVPSQIGKFFGDVDGHIMKQLLKHNLFFQHDAKDHQGMCIKKIELMRAFAPSLRSLNFFNSLFSVFNYASIFLYEFYRFLFNFYFLNFFEWFKGLNEDLFVESLGNEPTENYQPCDTATNLYQRNFENRKSNYFNQKVECNSTDSILKCKRRFHFAGINDTNLALLVVVDSPDCSCDLEQFNITKTEVSYKDTSEKCKRLLFQKHRRRPPQCHNFHKDEDSKTCGNAFKFTCRSPLALLLFSVVFFKM